MLYAVEEQARDKSTEERVALRQAKAKPVFDELEAWLQAQLPGLSGKNRLAGAIRHARNRMPKAPACLGDGRLELDNNIRQRSIRPIALGHWGTGALVYWAARTIASWAPAAAAARPPPLPTHLSRPPG